MSMHVFDWVPTIKLHMEWKYFSPFSYSVFSKMKTIRKLLSLVDFFFEAD